MCFLPLPIRILLLVVAHMVCNILDLIAAFGLIAKTSENVKILISVSIGLNFFVCLVIAVGIIGAVRRYFRILMIYLVTLLSFVIGKLLVYGLTEKYAKKHHKLIVTQYFQLNTIVGFITFVFVAFYYNRMKVAANQVQN
ncbi:uncharacterized protein LOC117571430 [Drosophila albomicans]|uniref:Uncharacterized protein LOC117571430 n=1 Tax=Drosophila albomicans TaxID=7291 RepID=A0A6P8X9W3_DROAB|nr:uncharacterized protein LOC117571430 [Drosophila albomicans]